MSPLVTVLVIMLLTVAFNESHHVPEYQDDYEKIIPKRPFELCDDGSRTKLCRTTNIWRELLKNTDEMFDDIHDLSRENVHDYMDEGEIQRIGQKRSNSHKLKEDCHITSKIKTLKDHFPSFVGNVSCDYEKNEELRKTLPSGWSCQPVEHKVKLLSKKVRDNIGKDTKDCWMRVSSESRALSKNTFDEDSYEMRTPTPYDGCWNFEDIYIHVGCSLKYNP